MENQHRKITGYRELDAEEIASMNEIKAMGEELAALVSKLRGRQAYHTAKYGTPDDEPVRWLDIGQGHLQTGLMALTRAVAQPESF